MKDMVIKEYSGIIGNKKLNIKIRDRLTVIIGDSGVGKTLLWLKLASASAFRDDIVCFNFVSKTKLIKEFRKRKSTLFVVDNADIIMTLEDKIYASNDFNNQYIIIGRNTEGLDLSYKNIAELVVDGDSIRLKYSGGK